MSFIVWIIAGIIAGWATGKIMKGSGYGFWLDMLLGIVGAWLGNFIAAKIGFVGHNGGFLHTILVGIVGAVIIVFVFRLITGKRG